MDITDGLIQSACVSAIGIDAIVSYHFYNDVAKEPIAIVTLQMSSGRTVRLDLSPLPSGLYFFYGFDENKALLWKEKLVKG